MKNIVLVMTHHGSDWRLLAEFLNGSPDIQVYETGNSYWHPDDLSLLMNRPHKKNNAASVWVDVLFHNKDFACEALCRTCGFIYWVSPFDEDKCSDMYYRHRLFGLQSYFRRTPKAIWNPELNNNLFFSSVFGREDTVVTSEFNSIPQI